MVVQHNISAMTANRYYGINNKGLAGSLEKLASGYAINKAGDNAAGLAVSEKMRAQIGGLTQASKNAEDGISLVQTMEGALQETDSILQRMRTLAVQSANGSYQDDVDREAMQLEFDQLNDELNQIADTDFNGTVMLNGGVMADGLKAVNGKFDYSKADRSAKQLSEDDVNLVDSQQFDTSDTTNGKTKADTVWTTLNSNWNRTNAITSDDGPESIDVSLQYNANTNEWAVTDASGGADYTKFTSYSGIAATDNGGFTLQAGGVDVANVVVDSTKLKDGDSLVLTLTNPAAGIAAPTNAGATATDGTLTVGTDTNAIKTQDADLKVELGAKATDADMTEAVNKIFDNLDGDTVKVTYAADGTESVKIGDSTGDVAIGTSLTALAFEDGSKAYAKVASGVVSIYSDSAGANEILKLTPKDQTSTSNGSTGTVTYKLGIEYNNYDTSKLPTVSVKKPEGSSVSKSNAFDQSKATMTYTDSLSLQVGARTKDLVNFTFSYDSNGLGDLKSNLNCSSRTDGLGTADLSIADQKSANAAIDKIDNALNKVNMVRATFGAAQNRLEHKINNIDTNTENLTAAESRIRDTQMDKEMMKFTSAQILSQASQSMLAQANSLPQGVLQLLG